MFLCPLSRNLSLSLLINSYIRTAGMSDDQSARTGMDRGTGFSVHLQAPPCTPGQVLNPHNKIKPTGLQSIRTGTFPSIQAPCHSSLCSRMQQYHQQYHLFFKTDTETISKAMVQNLTHSTVTVLLVGMSDIQ